jgi:hypothetical protein
MNWEGLHAIDWDALESTEDWVKMLNALLGLVESADTAGKRDRLARALDDFADHSTSDDLHTITRLDAAARKAARALRRTDIAAGVAELTAASDEFRALVKELAAAGAAMKKEAARLRAQSITSAVSSLTEAIAALKNLSQVLSAEDGDRLPAAIKEAVNSAQKLRGLLERPV